MSEYEEECGILFENALDLVLKLLSDNNYAATTIESYQHDLRPIGHYMLQNCIKMYTPNVGWNYYDYYLLKFKPDKRRSKALRAKISTLNDVCTGTELRPRRSYTPKKQLSSDYKKTLQDYLSECIQNGNKPGTIRKKRVYVESFLLKCNQAGCYSVFDLIPETIVNVYLQVSKESWKVIRMFLLFLCKSGLTNNDFSLLVPHFTPLSPVPSTYSVDEIKKTESYIERTTGMGKRDYAMFLLASRLGMRVGDIANLTFDNCDFTALTISFEQEKTGEYLRHPMLPEIKEALEDYINYGRPKVNASKIFIRSKAPLIGLTGTAVSCSVKKYMKLANINTNGKKCGGHSLRSSLATSMVNDDIPYEVVRKILGQIDPSVLKHYAKLDISKLRKCSIEVTEPTSFFLDFLERRVAV